MGSKCLLPWTTSDSRSIVDGIMVSKRTVMIGAVGGMTIGSVVPFLWGDYNTFGSASIFIAMVGGFLGIWLVVWLSKRF